MLLDNSNSLRWYGRLNQIACSVIVMSQADIERTELVRLPASGRRLEAETLRVDQRNDGEGCSAIGQVDAANAAVILDKDAQEVLVSDALGMAS